MSVKGINDGVIKLKLSIFLSWLHTNDCIWAILLSVTKSVIKSSPILKVYRGSFWRCHDFFQLADVYFRLRLWTANEDGVLSYT